MIDWESLATAGIEPGTPLKLHLWDATLGQALTVVLTLSGHQGAASFGIKDGIIYVASAERLQSLVGPVIRIYDVHDLVEQLISFRGGTTQPASPWAGRMRATGQNDAGSMTTEEALESLVRCIEDAVASDSWKDNGGSVGAIRELGGRLIITQTAENHRLIVGLLRTQRAGGKPEGQEIISQTK